MFTKFVKRKAIQAKEAVVESVKDDAKRSKVIKIMKGAVICLALVLGFFMFKAPSVAKAAVPVVNNYIYVNK